MKHFLLPLLLLALALGAGIAGLERWLRPLEWPPAVALLLLPVLLGYLASRATPRHAFALGFALMLVAWMAAILIEALSIRHAPAWDESRILIELPFVLLTPLPGVVLGFAAGGIGLALRRRNG